METASQKLMKAMSHEMGQTMSYEISESYVGYLVEAVSHILIVILGLTLAEILQF